MAYIPDEWVMKRLDVALSAQQILFYYCARADQDTGETNVSIEKTSQDLGIRKDHVSEHDRKLVRKGFIAISAGEFGGRIVRLLAPWQSRAERHGQSAQRAEKQAASQVLGKRKRTTTQNLGESTQNLGSPLNTTTQNLGESTQNLGSPLDEIQPDSPKLGDATQNLGKSTQNLGKSTQNLGSHIRNNQPMNQPMEPAQTYSGASAPEVVTVPPKSSPAEPKAKRPSNAKPPKSPFHSHPAVVAYREITGFVQINAAQASLIAQVIGPEVEAAPAAWLNFLRELAETGNEYTHNVQVMAMAYERYETGACLAEALDAAWSRQKGRDKSSATTRNRGRPTLAEINRAAAEEARRLLGFGDLIEAEAL